MSKSWIPFDVPYLTLTCRAISKKCTSQASLLQVSSAVVSAVTVKVTTVTFIQKATSLQERACEYIGVHLYQTYIAGIHHGRH